MCDNLLKDAVRLGDTVKVEELIRLNGLPSDNLYSKGYSLLRKALKKGHVDIARFLLREGAIVNEIIRSECQSRHESPIHLAVRLGNLGIVEELLNRGAQINSLNNDHKTPLHLAAEKSDDKIADLLLSKGANVNAKDIDGNTALSISCQERQFSTCPENGSEKLALTLLDNRADVDAQNNRGYTPLHYAIEFRNRSMVKLLIKRKANVNLGTKRDILPLHIAIDGGDEPIILLLLDNNANIHAQDFWGSTPLHKAVDNCNLVISKILLSRGVDVNAKEINNKSPLHTAVEYKEETMTSLLLDNNADLEVSEIRRGYRPIHYAIESGNRKIIDLLLSKGADVNSRTCNGSSALHLAIYRNDQETVKKLIENGADVSITDQNNKTPLRLAVENGLYSTVQEISQTNSKTDDKSTLKAALFSNEQSRDEIIKVLLKNGYTFDVDDIEDGRILNYSVENDHFQIVECLLNHGANIDNDSELLHAAVRGNNVKICEMLIDCGIDVNACDKCDRKAIHYADQKEIIDLLIRNGADIDSKDNIGKTALHLSIEEDRNAFHSLLEYDMDIDAQDNEGNTALHLAVRKAGCYIVALLLDKGSEVNITNNQGGGTPLDCAIHEEDQWEEYTYDTWSSNPYLGIDELIIEHITKLKAAGFCVRAKNLSFDHKYLSDSIDPDCRKELKKLRSIIMRDNVTLYDALIRRNVSKLDQDFIEILECIDFYEFPLYCKLMETNLKKYKQRNNLIRLGIESFHTINRVRKLPIAIIEKIVCELGRQDLENLHRAADFSKIHLAVRMGRLDTVEELLKNGAHVDSCNNRQQTSLHLASLRCHKDIVRLLLSKGANVSAKDNDGNTALSLSCQKGQSEIAVLLLNNQADINAQNKRGYTPLHHAIESGNQTLVELLIERKANVLAKTHVKVTPLHIAVKCKDEKTVSLLLSVSDADLEVSEINTGYRPLHYAIGSGNQKIIDLLLSKGADVNSRTINNLSPLFIAISRGDEETFQKLINNGADVGRIDKEKTALLYVAVVEKGLVSIARDILQLQPNQIIPILHSSVEKGYHQVVEFLLNYGANPNNVKDGCTLIHTAIGNNDYRMVELLIKLRCDVNAKSLGKSPIRYAVERCFGKIVELLLDNGADIDDELELLHTAVKENSFEVCRLLIDRGSDVIRGDQVNSINKNRETPLHLAAYNGHEEIARLLLSNGANVDARDFFGRTPLSINCNPRFKNANFLSSIDCTLRIAPSLDFVARSERLALLLITNQANINAKDNNGNTPLHESVEGQNLTLVEHLIRKNAEIDPKNKYGRTPLHYAAESGKEKLVEILLSGGANVNVKDNDNTSPLHMAMKYEKGKIRSNFFKYNSLYGINDLPIHAGNQKIIDLLLSNGADVNSRTRNGSSPLHFAITCSDQESAKKLIENGADVSIINQNKLTPLRIAVENGLYSTIQEILQINSKTDDKSTLKAAVFSEESSADGIVEILLKYGYTFDADYIEDGKLMKKCVERGYYELVKCLLNHGANPNYGDGSSYLPYDVIRKGRYEMFELLIKSKCNVRAKYEDKCLIYYAIEYGRYEMVELLIKLKCNVNAKFNAKSLLYYAIVKGDEKIVKLLLENGANIEDNFELLYTAAKGGFVKVCQILLDYGLDVNSIHEYGRTVLHYSFAYQKYIIELLIQNGADIDSKDSKLGWTALHLAIHKRWPCGVTDLLEFDHDTDAQDDDGNTALHLAARSGFCEAVELLVYKGYDVNATNNDKETPLEGAINGMHAYSRGSERQNDYERVIILLEYHTLKLKAAGLNVEFLGFRFDHAKLEDIFTELEDCEAKFEDCKTELKKIKDRNIFLHNALIKCNVPRLGEDLIEIFESIDYEEFPIYGELMKTNLKNNSLRTKLISLGTESFCTLNSVKKLPVEVVEKIVCELDNGSLKKLISCNEEFKDKWKIHPSTSAGNVKKTSVIREL